MFVIFVIKLVLNFKGKIKIEIQKHWLIKFTAQFNNFMNDLLYETT